MYIEHVVQFKEPVKGTQRVVSHRKQMSFNLNKEWAFPLIHVCAA